MVKTAHALVTVVVPLVLSTAAATGATWALELVYVPTAIIYIAGALYLLKRLMDYRPTPVRGEERRTGSRDFRVRELPARGPLKTS